MVKTYKTIILTLLLCISVVIALFIYRAQQVTPKAYSSNNTTVFSPPQAIKAFTLITANSANSAARSGKLKNQIEEIPFTQKDLLGHYTLLFFGFSHCANVCPVTLEMLGAAYDKLVAIEPSTRIVFVSLDPSRDTPERLIDYTHKFNTHIVGVTGKLTEIRKLQAQLKIFSEKDTATNSDADPDHYQIQHTSSILLINPKGEWLGLFSYGMNPDTFVREFTLAIHANV